MAAAIFSFTDAIPGAEVGTATQQVDLAAGTLVSSVRLTVFPNISGDVVTRSSASRAPPLCALYSAFVCQRMLSPLHACVRGRCDALITASVLGP